MSDLIKVEITNLDTDEWQWMGKLTKSDLILLCYMADKLSDMSVEASLNE